MSERIMSTLGDVADVTKLAGYEFTKHIQYNSAGEIIALRALNLKNGVLDLANVQRISKAISDALPRSKLYRNDILFSYTGSVGEVARVDEDDKYHLAPNICRLRVIDSADATYVYYYLRSSVFKRIMSGYVVGSTQMTIPMKNIRQIQIPLAPLAEQKAIASVLSALDDKIENNRRMNETLEEMARAIFKSWFVDFDPVRAKADGKLPAHMDAETAALFPSSFGDDGLPVGWSWLTLGDVCNIKSGKRPPTKLTAPDIENDISVYGGNGISWYTNEVLFAPPFIITGRVGTLGTVYRVYEKCWVSDNALCCFPIDENTFELVYFSMKTIDYQSLNSGSTQPLLTQTTLKNQAIIAAPKKVSSAFHQQAGMLFKKILANDEENQTLAQLRDTLLPKLMSGEIRVKDAEQEVEAVA